MPNVLLNSFNTGEISGLCESRSDLSKFSSACKKLENFLPLVEGGAKKMPGTYFAGATKNGTTNKARLVPFQFSTDQGAVLEFSAGVVRIWEGATEGSWSLGLAQVVPTSLDYNPVTAYVSGNTALVGPTFSAGFYKPPPYPFGHPPPDLGQLYISSPYGTGNAYTVPITFSIFVADTLTVFKTGTSPNQGIGIAIANATPSNNAAPLIQAAIRSLGSLNSSTSNYVDLSSWTVTPDSVYYATPWITLNTSYRE